MSSKAAHSEESKAEILYHLARRYCEQRMWKNAEDATAKALAIFRRLKGENSEVVGELECNLGTLLSYQGKFDAAEIHLQKALNNWTLAGQKTEEIAAAYDKLGTIMRGKRRAKDAEEHHKKSLAIFKHIYGETHKKVAGCFNNIGTACRDQGRHDEGKEHFEKALEIYEKLPPGEGLAFTYNNLAHSYMLKEELAQAEEMLHKFLLIYPSLPDKDDEKLAAVLGKMGNLKAEQRKLQDAKKYFNDALRIYESLNNRFWIFNLKKTLQTLDEGIALGVQA